MRRFILYTALILLLNSNVQAQEYPYQFDRVTGGNSGVLQDSRGYMWFIDEGDGLIRYDGYESKFFDPDPDNPNDFMDRPSHLIEDHQGIFWITTFGDGLIRFDPLTETFTQFAHDPDDPLTLRHNMVRDVFEDSEHTLWVSTANGVLHRFDRETEQFTAYPHVPESWFQDPRGFDDWPSYPAGPVILEDRNGQLWVGSWGLHLFDKNTGRFTRYLPEPNYPAYERTDPQRDFRLSGPQAANAVIVLLENREGHIFLGTAGGGLWRFDPQTRTFTRLEQGPENNSYVSALFEDSRGGLWAGGLGRLYHQSSSSNTFVQYDIDVDVHYGNITPSNKGRLGIGHMSQIYEDRQGVLWVVGYGGAQPTDLYSERFVYIDPAPTHQGMLEEPDGTLWIGQEDGTKRTLIRYNPQTKTQIDYPYVSGGESNGTWNYLALLMDRDSTIWMTTYDGVVQFNRETGTFYRPPAVPSKTMNAVVEDQDGYIWIGGWGSGVLRLDRKTGEVLDHFFDGEEIRWMHADLAGGVWAHMQDLNRDEKLDYEIVRFFPRDDGYDITYFRNVPEDPTTLSSNGVYFWGCERKQEPGVLWAGTYGAGLNRIDSKTGLVKRYTKQNSGLPEDSIYRCVEDKSGTLWLSTGGPIIHFDPDTETFRHFDANDGLPRTRVGAQGMYAGPSGNIYVETLEGLIIFDPLTLNGNPNPPKVSLTGLHINNQSIEPGPDALLKQSLLVTNALTLDHNQNDIMIDYVGLHFSEPGQLQYRYRLLDEVESADWINMGTQRRAMFRQLAPGSYTFEVQAQSPDGVWSPEGATLNITIRPPWWQAWWMFPVYTSLGLMLLGFMLVMQRRRVQRLERERTLARELEQARKLEQAYDDLERAHDELGRTYANLKTTQAQLIQSEKMASLGALTAGIAHEIKNPLNFINNFADLTLEITEELEEILAQRLQALESDEEIDELLDDLKQFAQKIGSHGQRADAIVRMMMQHAGTSTGEREAVTLNDLVEQNLNLAYHGLTQDGMPMHILLDRDYGTDVGQVTVQPQEMGRVLLNLFNNAFYAVYEQAGRQNGQYLPQVKVQTRRTDDGVEIRVTDNGPGIPTAVREKIYEPFFTTKPPGEGTGLGLSLSHDIVVQGHGGRLRVESEEGQGATFVVILPTPPT